MAKKSPVVVPTAGNSGKTSEELAALRAAFDDIDENGNGEIEVTELRHLASKVGVEIANQEALNDVLKSIDLDGTGTIGFEEFVKMMEKVHSGSAEDFEKAFVNTISNLTVVQMNLDDNILPLWMQIEKKARANGKYSARVQMQCTLGAWLDGTTVQIVVLGLVFLDILAVFAELLLDATMCSEVLELGEINNPKWKGNPSQTTAYYIFKYMSLTVLMIFMAQILSLMAIYGRLFWTNKFYILDFVVVGISLVFDGILKMKSATLVNVLRSWRILRIIHGLLSSMEIQEKQTHTKIEKTKVEVYSKVADNVSHLTEGDKEEEQKQAADFASHADSLREKLSLFQAETQGGPKDTSLTETERQFLKLYDHFQQTQSHMNTMAYQAGHNARTHVQAKAKTQRKMSGSVVS